MNWRTSDNPRMSGRHGVRPLQGIVALLLAAVAVPAFADPCGMVPPIYVGPGTSIARTGDQNTYVFYKDGVETFIIHPGFKGKVEEFGMLIPFPAVPELRKVSDSIFPHVRAAIDPPEVVVYVNRFPGFGGRGGGFRRSKAVALSALSMEKMRDEVRVVKEEAVGMYEVAVLDAGSAKALQKWMDDHGYKYPKGMDKACDDYVQIGWCFVAVKSKVGSKKAIDPKPGMRSVKTGLPAGASFDGHVQAMGFRFRSKRLVVPMRLSTFNEGDLHNIVYVLTDGPRKIRSVPEEYVVRQISGDELYKNVTQPLPLRIVGGTAKDLQPFQKTNLKSQRNPVPHNGAARDVFAADLLAVKTGQLSHPHEEKEKMLLRIGESLGLRGTQIDALNEGALADQREKIVAKSLKDIKGMTLTVIDGNFPREVLANQNLAFAPFRMPARRNSSRFYDANTKQPARRQQGTLVEGAVSFDEGGKRKAEGGQTTPVLSAIRYPLFAFGAFSFVAFGALWTFRRKAAGRAVGLLLSAGMLLSAAAPSMADVKKPEKADPALKKQTNLQLIDDLKDPKKASAAAKELISRGKKAIPDLIGEAVEGNDLSQRGWSIICMAEIGGKEAANRLLEIQNDAKQPPLVRTWAAAGRVKMATTTPDLLNLANLIGRYPALQRPIGMKLLANLTAKGQKLTAEDLLATTMKVPQLQQALAPVILNLGADPLVKAMRTSKNQNIRRQAAGYLASLAQRGEDSVAPAVVKAYQFDPKAKKLPWDGGPLFIPLLNWNSSKDKAKALVSGIIAWYVWTEENVPAAQRAGTQQPIINNLNSIQLASAAGYRINWRDRSVDTWLRTWGGAAGKKEIEKILKAQKVAGKPRYKRILDSLK
jgi:Uncharacterized protein conserved in bacteria (DUF2330)